ncbi:MAG TPA: hypothetical protein VHK27_03235 [Gammaproteobacteria bacterium]|nr:hypothetical protein [Gammaproteobacteria bacterium]
MMELQRPHENVVVKLLTSGAAFDQVLEEAQNLWDAVLAGNIPANDPLYGYQLIEFKLRDGRNAFAEYFPFSGDWWFTIDVNGFAYENF